MAEVEEGPFHVPLSYHREILHEFANESGLLVMARGLGIEKVVESLCHLYADRRLLVFVLNADASDDFGLSEDGVSEGTFFWESSQCIRSIPSEMGAKDRVKVYSRGGVIVLSARVFLMDLLLGRIPIPLVTGVMVQDGHRVSEYGMIAFCLHLLRQGNQTAFIKAFSDSPEALVRGFAKTEKLMKTFRISSLLLYPRFHVKVSDELGKAQLVITEVKASLTQRMKMMQLSLMSILETSMNDICKDNALDTKDFNAELSVFAEFDAIIQQHLESNWHRVGFKTKQLLGEIRTLRAILSMALDLDAISFHQYLQQQVQAAQGVRYQSAAYWLFSESSNVLLEVARERARAWEPNPKWKALLDVVSDAETARQVASGAADSQIVIVTGSKQSACRLSAVLCLGIEEYMRRMAAAFLPADGPGAKRPSPETECEDSLSIRTGFPLDEFLVQLTGRRIVVRTAEDMNIDALRLLNPFALILFQPHLELVRVAEVYKRLHNDAKMAVYFFIYRDSVEEQKYLAAIRREKEAFEQLIRTKTTMVPYHEEAGIKAEALIEDSLRLNRDASPIVDPEFPRKVVVDTRDLRSSLPFLLHLYGFEILPQTIAVGDYILSPTMAVERKSLSDLISSLNNGRLLSQVQAMSRKFGKYILLIEFDPDKPFYLLQSKSASALKRSDLSPTDLISKLVLLLLHYPKLKLLWTSGPKLTCDIFFDLKRNESNPDAEETESSGVESGSVYDEQVKDLLLKLPGVNPQNYYLVMRKYVNMAELVNASKRELVDVLGLENGGKLHGFINAKLG